ncbi:arylsulfatase [Phycisphaeraceae bacterium D3-23]
MRIPAVFTLLLTLLAGQPALAQGDAQRPNIIVILCDDLGQGDPGCYNPDSKIPTPHIDRLAAEGMMFTDAHTNSSVCTPTRYGVLTGRYCWRSRLKNGVLWGGWDRALLEEGRTTIATMVARRGYTSAAIGKWHLGFDWQSTDGSTIAPNHHPADVVRYDRPVLNGPMAHGFDHSYLIPASLDMAPYFWLVDDRALVAPTEHTEGSGRRWSGGGGFWRAGPIAPGFDFYDVVPTSTEQAVAFIENHGHWKSESLPNDDSSGEDSSGDRPFFLYFPLPAPHTPWMPTPEFQGDTEVGWYGDFVAQTDWALGRILAALDRNGLAENTIVIFTSDNGSHWPENMIAEFGHDANNGWRGQKADIWEAGHRVPFIVRWPAQVEAGTASEQLVCTTDLLATIAQAVGVDLGEAEGEDSVSFLPVLLGQEDDAIGLRESVVHHSVNGTFAIRRGDWKLILNQLGSGGFTNPRNRVPGRDNVPTEVGGQLYNLANDPGEATNLWAEHPEIVTELAELLDTIRE